MRVAGGNSPYLLIYFPCEGKQPTPQLKASDNYPASAKPALIYVMKQAFRATSCFTTYSSKNGCIQNSFSPFFEWGGRVFGMLFSKLTIWTNHHFRITLNYETFKK